MKISAKPTLPYSILKPETSSDSPSAKSKGVRLVSARLIINQSITIGINNSSLTQLVFWDESRVRLKVSPVNRKNKITKANLTS